MQLRSNVCVLPTLEGQTIVPVKPPKISTTRNCTQPHLRSRPFSTCRLSIFSNLRSSLGKQGETGHKTHLSAQSAVIATKFKLVHAVGSPCATLISTHAPATSETKNDKKEAKSFKSWHSCGEHTKMTRMWCWPQNVDNNSGTECIEKRPINLPRF
jgi:hypothetical protein